jgi:dTDP-L-rhamnose 4-epimerase
MRQVRALVTGGNGFIGRQLVAQLLEAGYEVRVLDLVRGNGSDDQVLGDVRDAEVVDAALAGVDAVCHLAAKVGLGVDVQDLPDYASVNDYGTAVLLAGMARAGVDRLVLASSMVVYGEGIGSCSTHGLVRPAARREADLAAGRFEPPCPACGRALRPALVEEDTPFDPRNAYAASKVAQEHLAASWARATGATVTALRYHNVYGPGLPRDTPYAGVAAIFRSALAAGRPPQVFEDGRQRRGFEPGEPGQVDDHPALITAESVHEPGCHHDDRADHDPSPDALGGERPTRLAAAAGDWRCGGCCSAELIADSAVTVLLRGRHCRCSANGLGTASCRGVGAAQSPLTADVPVRGRGRCLAMRRDGGPS